LQLAMAMAFVGLPATVLFPIIAQPVAEKSEQTVMSNSAAFEHRVQSTTLCGLAVRKHWDGAAMAAWHSFKQHSITHRGQRMR
jgi:hypothetical protein